MLESLKNWVRVHAPYPYRFHLQRRWRITPDQRRQNRHDIVHYALTDNAYFEVFWKIYGIGRGPAIALFIHEQEVLKFDFYGEGRGHYHLQLMDPPAKCQNQLFLPEKTVEEQIERAIFELNKNLAWYLDRHPLQIIRDFQVNRTHLRQVLDQVRLTLLDYQQRMPPESPAIAPVTEAGEMAQHS